MKALPQITEAEYEVMKLVWEKHPISTNEITETLTAVSAWSPKTVQTLIKRLTDKGALTYQKKGRMFYYTPAVRKDEYVSRESRSFLNRFYGGHLSAMVSAYLEQGTLSEEERNQLRSLLDEKKEDQP